MLDHIFFCIHVHWVCRMTDNRYHNIFLMTFSYPLPLKHLGLIKCNMYVHMYVIKMKVSAARSNFMKCA